MRREPGEPEEITILSLSSLLAGPQYVGWQSGISSVESINHRDCFHTDFLPVLSIMFSPQNQDNYYDLLTGRTRTDCYLAGADTELLELQTVR